MNKLFFTLGVIFLLAVGFALWFWGVNDPYVGSYNTNNNYIALAAKNYIRFGFWNLKMLPTYIASSSLPQNNEYYLHHPILFFWLATIPYVLFGPANWLVHVAACIFMVGIMGMIYVLARLLFSRKVATVSLILAVLFPMTGFYWKLIFFEHISLFLNLVIIYLYVLYLKHPQKKLLFLIGIHTFVCMLSDWYAGYLIFPFLFMVMTRYRKSTLDVLKVYVPMLVLGILLFLGIVWKAGLLSDLQYAITTRAVGSELFSFRYWVFTLSVVTFLRLIIYFSPLSLVSIFVTVKSGIGKIHTFQQTMLIFLFILGCLNIVFLPNASWGHSYFIFYLIPFFAISGGVIISNIKNSRWIAVILVLFSVWSIGVDYLKLQQLRKQMWKYDFGTTIATIVPKYQLIANMNYPGDVLQNYFFIPTISFTRDQYQKWVSGDIYSEIPLTVFTCLSDCNQEEKDFIRTQPETIEVVQYTIGRNDAWILRKIPADQLPVSQKTNLPQSVIISDQTRHMDNITPIIQYYRMLKRIIGEVQL